ncbi:MAG: hypothetical protein IRZ07_13860 [Microbispora sp.]|nr:hypothetical protein [Microbispora sp.]
MRKIPLRHCARHRGPGVGITIPNPDGLPADEHPFVRDLVRDLGAAGIPLRSVVA